MPQTFKVGRIPTLPEEKDLQKLSTGNNETHGIQT